MTPTKQWIGVMDIAIAVGISRAALDNLKRLTRPNLDHRMDHTTPSRNLRLYDLDQIIQWLNHHIPLNSIQLNRLMMAAREVLPAIHEGQST